MVHMTIVILISYTAFLTTSLMADEDCYKYGEAEFTTIVECKHGCEYTFKTKGKGFKRLSGGCSKTEDSGCRKGENGATICTCKGDLCNLSGYIMQDSSESSDH